MAVSLQMRRGKDEKRREKIRREGKDEKREKTQRVQSPDFFSLGCFILGKPGKRITMTKRKEKAFNVLYGNDYDIITIVELNINCNNDFIFALSFFLKFFMTMVVVMIMVVMIMLMMVVIIIMMF